MLQGLPGGTSGKEPAADTEDLRKRCGFDPWVGKIRWRRAWQPTPVSLPGESRGQRRLQAMAHRVAKSRTRLEWQQARNTVMAAKEKGHPPFLSGSLSLHLTQQQVPLTVPPDHSLNLSPYSPSTLVPLSNTFPLNYTEAPSLSSQRARFPTFGTLSMQRLTWP